MGYRIPKSFLKGTSGTLWKVWTPLFPQPIWVHAFLKKLEFELTF